MSNLVNDERTFIGKNTIIEGADSNIVCGGDLEIKGQVKGTVKVSGALTVFGLLEGQSEAGSVSIESNARHNGPINCANDLTVKKDSTVVGDIKAKSASIASNVQGNVQVASELALAPTATVIGNITSSTLSVESGAVLEGNISIKK